MRFWPYIAAILSCVSTIKAEFGLVHMIRKWNEQIVQYQVLAVRGQVSFLDEAQMNQLQKICLELYVISQNPVDHQFLTQLLKNPGAFVRDPLDPLVIKAIKIIYQEASAGYGKKVGSVPMARVGNFFKCVAELLEKK